MCATTNTATALQNFVYFDSIYVTYGIGNKSNYAVRSIVYSNNVNYLPDASNPDTSAVTTLGLFNASVNHHAASFILGNKYMAPYWGGSYTVIFEIKDSTNHIAYDTITANIQHNKYCRKVAVNDNRTVAVNQPVAVAVQANDFHVSKTTSALSISNVAQNGTVSSFTSSSQTHYAHYKPNSFYRGLDSFYYTEYDTNVFKLGIPTYLQPDTGWVKIHINQNLASPAGKDSAICIGQFVNLGVLTCGYMFPEGSPSNTAAYFSDSVKWYQDTIGKAIDPASNPMYSNCNAQVTLTPLNNLNGVTLYIAEYDGGIYDSVFAIYPSQCPVITDAGVDKISCLGSIIHIGGTPTVYGGVPPYTYSWTPNTWLLNGQDTLANPLVTPATVGSVTYTITVTDALGQNNVDSMVLSVFSNPSYKTINDTICSNHPYSFKSQNLIASGIYHDTLANYYGCDSFITLNLFVKPIQAHSYTQTICSSSFYSFNGNNLNTTGAYYDTINSVNGCDSFITLNLIVNQSSSHIINQAVCSNSSYSFNGNNLNTTGTYFDTLPNTVGCDSLITLNLIVHSTSTKNIIASICSNQVYSFDGNNLNTTGVYKDTLPNYYGCDSVITLNLTVIPTSSSTILQTVCSNVGYLFHSNTLTTSGTYFDTLMNANNCDSVITLNLTVLNSPSTILAQTVCYGDSALFKGIYFKSSGVYFDTLASYNACDSLVTFNLTVLPILITNLNQNVCFGNSFLFNGNNISTNGIYLDTLQSYLSCDSFITLNLFVRNASYDTINQTICANHPYLFNGANLTATGTYYDTLVSYVSCDSFITLHLVVNPISNYSYNHTICSNHPYLFNGANLTASGIYYDTLQNQFGCDSFVTLNLTVNPISNFSFSQTICAGNSVLFNGNTLTTTGTYLDTLAAANSCDSFVTFHLTVNPISNYSYNHFLCAGGTYLFNGNTLNATGIYHDTLTNYLLCDSFVTLHLNVVSASTHTINQTICNNHPYTFNGNQLTSSGTYYDTLVNYVTCDSFITLNLIVHPISTYSYNHTICANHPYLFNNHLLNSSGIYFDTLVNYLLCDSFVTLNLTVNPISIHNYSQTICSGNSINFNGNNLTAFGTYHDTLQNQFGCDSFINLTLIVLPNATHSYNQTICAGHVLNFFGNNISTAGTFSHVIVGGAANGCDSTVILNTSLISSTYRSYSQTICSNFPILFNNHLINTGGIYLDTLVNFMGCDSFVQLNLTVVPQQVTNLYQNICAGTSFTFFGNSYTSTGVYTDSIPASGGGCAQIYILHLTVQPYHTSTITKTICSNAFYFNGQTYTVSGFYTIHIPLPSGCDSIINLNLSLTTINVNLSVVGNSLSSAAFGSTISWIDCSTNTVLATGLSYAPTVTGTYGAIISSNGCSDTTACYYFYIPASNGINNVDNDKWIQLYPNPAEDDVTLNINCEVCKQLKMELMDISGRILRVENVSNKKQFIIHRADIKAGIYFIRLTNENGLQVMKKLVWN
jgi:hypothetical protein